jgi:hypothetical protein
MLPIINCCKNTIDHLLEFSFIFPNKLTLHSYNLKIC